MNPRALKAIAARGCHFPARTYAMDALLYLGFRWVGDGNGRDHRWERPDGVTATLSPEKSGGCDRFGVSLENAARVRIKGADGAWIDIDALMPLGVQG